MLQTDNQTVWEFHNKELVLKDNVVSELIASDVTEQYQMAMYVFDNKLIRAKKLAHLCFISVATPCLTSSNISAIV